MSYFSFLPIHDVGLEGSWIVEIDPRDGSSTSVFFRIKGKGMTYLSSLSDHAVSSHWPNKKSSMVFPEHLERKDSAKSPIQCSRNTSDASLTACSSMAFATAPSFRSDLSFFMNIHSQMGFCLLFFRLLIDFGDREFRKIVIRFLLLF